MNKTRLSRAERLARRRSPRRVLVVREDRGEELPRQVEAGVIVIHVTRLEPAPLPEDERLDDAWYAKE